MKLLFDSVVIRIGILMWASHVRAQPSAAPSVSATPSSVPTCEEVLLPAEICFAIDESGSICQVESGKGCNSCECRTPLSFPDDNFCCENFKSAADFSADLIRAYQNNVPDLEVAVRFFSTRVNDPRGPGLQSADDAIDQIENHFYIGGS